MPGPLVQRRWRGAAWGAVVAGLAVLAALGAVVFRGTSTAFDDRVSRDLLAHVGSTGAEALLALSDPYLSLVVLLGVAVCAALAGRSDIAVFTVVGPAVAILTTEYVLKPLFGRLIGPGVFLGDTTDALRGSYPSGHETGVVSAALVLLVVCGQAAMSRRARAIVITLLALWTVLAAVGLVRNFYHYPTDTIGAFGYTVAVLLAAALAVDRYLPTVRRRVAARRVS